MKAIIIATLIVSPALFAQTTVNIEPTKDNSIYSESDNSNGMGQHLYVGVTNQGNERRAFVAFEDLSSIPAGSTIMNVELDVTVTLTNSGGAPIPVSLFETTKEWGEGDSVAPGAGGSGAEPLPGDVTWNVTAMPFNPDRTWDTPGGDFTEPALSTVDIPVSGSATFPNNQDFVDAVQGWLDGSRSNLGIIMVSSNSGNGNAKRLGSRENTTATRRPVLKVTYMESVAGDIPVIASGLWFDPSRDGAGFNVIESAAAAGKGTSVANSLTVFHYGYGADGNQLWLVSETLPGPFALNQAITFNMLAGGTSGNFEVPAPSSELVPWGTLAITLTSCTEGTFALDGVDGQVTYSAVLLALIDGISCSIDP